MVLLSCFLLSGCGFEDRIITGKTVSSKGLFENEPVLSVVSASNGLHIKKHHDSKWVYVTIHVFNVTDNVENAYISADEKKMNLFIRLLKKVKSTGFI